MSQLWNRHLLHNSHYWRVFIDVTRVLILSSHDCMGTVRSPFRFARVAATTNAMPFVPYPSS